MITKKAVVSRDNWILTVEYNHEQNQNILSLTDNYGIPRNIHQLLIFNHPNSSADELQGILLKFLNSPSRKDYRLQIQQFNNKITVLYGSYGLLGAGKDKIVAGFTSVAGIAGGCALVISGNPLGKILIDASTDLLFHTMSEEEVSFESCTKTILKGSAMSLATFGLMAGVSKVAKVGRTMSSVIPAADKIKNTAEITTIVPSKLTHVLQFGTKIAIQHVVTMSQKVLAESINLGIEAYQTDKEKLPQWKEKIKKKYNRDKIVKILEREFFISMIANSIYFGVGDLLLSKQGLFDLRAKHLLQKIKLNKSLARAIGKGIDNAAQSAILATTEESVACVLNQYRQFNKRSAAKIGTAIISGGVSGMIGKYKKIELERRIEKYISMRQKLQQERDKIFSKYGINEQLFSIFQMNESRKEIPLSMPTIPGIISKEEFEQFKKFVDDVNKMFQEKNTHIEKFINEEKEICKLETQNHNEYIAIIDDYRLNGGDLNKLPDELRFIYAYGKLGHGNFYVDSIIEDDNYTRQSLIRLNESNKSIEMLVKKLDERISKASLNEELATVKILTEAKQITLNVLKSTESVKTNSQKHLGIINLHKNNIYNVFSTSRIFKIENIDNRGKLTHDEIKKVQEKLSLKIANFVSKHQLDDKVLDPDEEALLREKYLKFKKVYDEISTAQEIEYAKKLLKEFMAIKGASIFLNQLSPASKIQLSFIHHTPRKFA